MVIERKWIPDYYPRLRTLTRVPVCNLNPLALGRSETCNPAASPRKQATNLLSQERNHDKSVGSFGGSSILLKEEECIRLKGVRTILR